MDRSRQQFLTSASFTADQDRSVALGDSGNLVNHFQKGGCFADQIGDSSRITKATNCGFHSPPSDTRHRRAIRFIPKRTRTAVALNSGSYEECTSSRTVTQAT